MAAKITLEVYTAIYTTEKHEGGESALGTELKEYDRVYRVATVTNSVKVAPKDLLSITDVQGLIDLGWTVKVRSARDSDYE